VKTKRLLKSLFLLPLCLFFVQCSRSKVDCQTPPPTLYFTVTKGGTTYPSASSTVALSYTDKSGKKAYIADLRAGETVLSTYELLTTSQTLGDPPFTVEINQTASGTINLKTYQDDSPCNGWVRQSELRFNGAVVNRNAQGFGA
jgi:hypothetical protein